MTSLLPRFLLVYFKFVYVEKRSRFSPLKRTKLYIDLNSRIQDTKFNRKEKRRKERVQQFLNIFKIKN